MAMESSSLSSIVLDRTLPLLMKVRSRFIAIAFRVWFRASPRKDLVRIGSASGGHWVPVKLLGPDSVCYCAGAGEDITFDLGLIERFDCEVVTIDPTPRAIEYVQGLSPSGKFAFVPVGLAGQAGELRFYAPRDAAHVSHSIVNLQRTSDFFVAQVTSLAQLMSERGHAHIDLLKMDIEGAHHQVFRSMHEDGVFPTVMCVEFDQPEPLRRTIADVRRLRSAGYTVVNVDRFDVTFVRDRARRA